MAAKNQAGNTPVQAAALPVTSEVAGALAPLSYVRLVSLPQLVEIQRHLDAAKCLALKDSALAALVQQAGVLLTECINDIEVEVLT